MKKSRKIIRIILLVLVSVAFLMSAFGKLSGSEQEIGLFTALNLPDFRVAAGLINIIIVLTLWWRPTRNIGTLIASSYLGAAILASLMLAPESAFIPGLVLLAVWVVAKFSHPCHYCSDQNHCHCNCETCKTCGRNDSTDRKSVV